MQSILHYSAAELALQQAEQASIDKAVALFNRFGALWIEHVFPESLLRTLYEAYLQEYAYPSAGKHHQYAVVIDDRRHMISVAIKAPFNNPALYAAPLLYPLLTALLGHNCVIDSFGSVCSYPGAKAQKIHADNPYLFDDEHLSISLPSYAITVAIPLIDINLDTGTTALWEGTHHQSGSANKIESLSAQAHYDDAALPMPKRGGMYMMDYRLIHAGTANISQQARPLFYLVYSRPWFRDAYNFGFQRERAMIIDNDEYRLIPHQYQHLFRGAYFS